MRQVEPPLAVIIISATRQKDVRQKNKNCHFSVSHLSVWWPGVAETMIKATAFGRNCKAFVLSLATNRPQNPLAPAKNIFARAFYSGTHTPTSALRRYIIS